jgi:UDP-glucose 4-epimerase
MSIVRGSRILITGGAGLIGSHIADELSAKGAGEIIVYDNFVRGRLDNLAVARASGRVTVVDADIRDRSALDRAMAGVDYVFHQAAIRITQCAEDPALAVGVLVNGTFNVLDAAVKAGVKKVVAASSASVYGLAEAFPTDESHHPYNNRTLYGAAKCFNEGLLRSFNDMFGLNYVALRYFNVYGPRMDAHGAYTEVFIRWMDRIAAGEPPLIFGDGKQTMDFIHVADIARANVLALEAPVTDRVFNVATGAETSLTDIAEALLRVMDSPLTPSYGPERKVNPVPRRLADTRQAAECLGFTARVALDEGLRSFVEWWKRERDQARNDDHKDRDTAGYPARPAVA